jgi:hypothetical protein
VNRIVDCEVELANENDLGLWPHLKELVMWIRRSILLQWVWYCSTAHARQILPKVRKNLVYPPKTLFMENDINNESSQFYRINSLESKPDGAESSPLLSLLLLVVAPKPLPIVVLPIAEVPQIPHAAPPAPRLWPEFCDEFSSRVPGDLPKSPNRVFRTCNTTNHQFYSLHNCSRYH